MIAERDNAQHRAPTSGPRPFTLCTRCHRRDQAVLQVPGSKPSSFAREPDGSTGGSTPWRGPQTPMSVLNCGLGKRRTTFCSVPSRSGELRDLPAPCARRGLGREGRQFHTRRLLDWPSTCGARATRNRQTCAGDAVLVITLGSHHDGDPPFTALSATGSITSFVDFLLSSFLCHASVLRQCCPVGALRRMITHPPPMPRRYCACSAWAAASAARHPPRPGLGRSHPTQQCQESDAAHLSRIARCDFGRGAIQRRSYRRIRSSTDWTSARARTLAFFTSTSPSRLSNLAPRGSRMAGSYPRTMLGGCLRLRLRPLSCSRVRLLLPYLFQAWAQAQRSHASFSISTRSGCVQLGSRHRMRGHGDGIAKHLWRPPRGPPVLLTRVPRLRHHATCTPACNPPLV